MHIPDATDRSGIAETWAWPSCPRQTSGVRGQGSLAHFLSSSRKGTPSHGPKLPRQRTDQPHDDHQTADKMERTQTRPHEPARIRRMGGAAPDRRPASDTAARKDGRDRPGHAPTAEIPQIQSKYRSQVPVGRPPRRLAAESSKIRPAAAARPPRTRDPPAPCPALLGQPNARRWPSQSPRKRDRG